MILSMLYTSSSWRQSAIKFDCCLTCHIIIVPILFYLLLSASKDLFVEKVRLANILLLPLLLTSEQLNLMVLLLHGFALINNIAMTLTGQLR